MRIARYVSYEDLFREPCDQIIAASSPPYQQYYQFLAGTGCRVGEAIWLAWDDVDFEHQVIRIRAKPGWKPKTGNERVIPMSVELRTMLQRQPRQWRWVFYREAVAQVPAGGAADLRSASAIAPENCVEAAWA